ncbi:class I SAM-dependent methyltransferase [Clostridium uliginosum]|uniref:Phospholipid N-methyltransferase n=1 Tax=Clostridium uliginosum TaxID=119641 RepID=A0A1I1QNW3_9CLOT|nr:rRNA adenine N-6-methyltransferase family protein [Clostridium uliginosum]SFD23715.1 Phospholipid N-methyltransferase [Clostridium uliginosum]
MKEISFFLQYIKKPRNIGAILPSTKYLGNKMIEDIDFKHTKCIIEYGPGTGVFTKKLLQNRDKNTIIMIFECNYEFYNLLKDKFKLEENLFIIHDSCENVDKYLIRYEVNCVDYVISGLPFASLPEQVSDEILKKTKSILKKDGKFITFQYTLLKTKLIKKYFKNIDLKREFRNVPPAYILSCINCN